MTDLPASESQRQSFLSKLRESSAIVFTIGLAISIASFVENLHMGKDAIAYVVAELSKIEGWADVVQTVAAIFHGALEWWRGVLRDLLSFLPFQVPQWLHDPLSLLLFGLVRIWSRRKRWQTPSEYLSGWHGEARHRLNRSYQFRRFAIQVVVVLGLLLIPMATLEVADKTYFEAHGSVGELLRSQPALIILYMLVTAPFFIASIYFLFSGMRADVDAYELRDRDQG